MNSGPKKRISRKHRWEGKKEPPSASSLLRKTLTKESVAKREKDRLYD